LAGSPTAIRSLKNMGRRKWNQWSNPLTDRNQHLIIYSYNAKQFKEH